MPNREPDPKNAFGLWDYRMLPKLNTILKPFGLRFTQRTNRKGWGDQVEIAVAQLPTQAMDVDTTKAVWDMLKAAMDVVAIHGSSKPEFEALNNARYELKKTRRMKSGERL